MTRLKAPEILMDVYRDLRDRRLLIVVAALLAAIVAIPLVLSKKPAATPAVPTPNHLSSSADMTVPAVVLADQPGATNYRKRLAAFQTKNPFKAQFVVHPTDSSGGTGASSASSSPIGGIPSSAASPSAAPSIGPLSPITTPPSSGGNGTPAGTGGNGGDGSTKPTIRTVTQLFTRRVDVSIGAVGETPKDLNSVEPMTILPNATTPVLAFLGTDENGKNAAFVLSSRSVATGGTASCVPAPQDCIYVTMKEGQSLTVDYTPKGSTEPVSYQVTLSKIRDVHVKQSKASPPAQGAAYARTGVSGG